MKQFSLFLLTIILQCIFNLSFAQNVKLPEKDIIDVIFGTKKTNKKPENDSLIPRKLYTSILPIPGYNPALGFVIGAGISTNFLSGSANKTHLSNILANATITTRNQFNLYARNMIFLKDDEWVLQGDWRWLIFSQPTYGLGINFKDVPNTTAKEEPMKFNYLRFYQTLYKKLWGTWYAGIGINIDRHYSIVDQLLDTSSANQYLTAHYNYSTQNKIRQDQYASVGISLNLLYDTRDNSVNPKKGQYAKMTFRINNEIFGSTRSHNI